MSNEVVDGDRRRFLTLATTGVGVVGVGAVAWPFLASLKPSAKALALGAPTAAPIDKIEEGQQVTFAWRGQNIWVLRRSKEMLDSLSAVTDKLADPDSEFSEQPKYCLKDPKTRSIKPEYLVMQGKCTHLGCAPTQRFDHPAPDIVADWQGGYRCPCHGSLYDLSGRVYKSMPAPLNLPIPPHRYASDSLIIIGEDQEAA